MAGDIIVVKFGSSVLRTLTDMPTAVHEIYRWYRAGWRVVAVVSAIGETTEELIRSARALATEPEPSATARAARNRRTAFCGAPRRGTRSCR